MSHRQMKEFRKLGESPQEPRGKQDLLEVQAFIAEKMEAMSLSSSASLLSVLYDEDPSAMEITRDTESSLKEAIHLKMVNMVKFLLLKSSVKEPTTQEEMMSIIRGHEHRFPELLRQASRCLQLVFGVDVQEVDASDRSYVLVPTLGLTCDGMWSGRRRMSKNGLLIMLLCVIYLEGDIAPEENVWEALNVMGVYDVVEQFIYGEPRELITKVWVQEQYVVYWQVAKTDPAHYAFLWGPRAHAETTKAHVLEFLLSSNEDNPSFFPSQSEEAETDQEEMGLSHTGIQAHFRPM